MPTLDIWSNSTSWRLRGLIQSSIANLLLAKNHSRPIYLCSPWVSDFPIFDNSNGQFSSLVPEVSDRLRINLSDCLVQLSAEIQVRIVSKKTTTTEAFCAIPKIAESNIEVRLCDDKLHEKGILTPIFYIEGSMNITYSGVMLNSEKVIYHSGKDQAIRERIHNTYLEFERRWEFLS